MGKKLLITGAGGLVGWNLCRAAADRFQVYGTYHTTPPESGPHAIQIDLLEDDAIKRMLDTAHPEVVIHTAAMTRSGECEKEREHSYLINTEIPWRLASACKERGTRLIHLSTDLVFDGRKGSPYVEADKTSPISHYGTTKAFAEEFVDRACSDYAILRVALIYGRSLQGDRGTSEWTVNSVQKNGSVTLFTDEFRTPIFVDDLCDTLLALAESDATGLFHTGGPERISRYDFGLKLAAQAGLDPSAIVAAQIADFTGTPPRTPDVSLDSTQLTALLNLNPHPLDAALTRLYPSS